MAHFNMSKNARPFWSPLEGKYGVSERLVRDANSYASGGQFRRRRALMMKKYLQMKEAHFLELSTSDLRDMM
jgi:hypothetical protein